MAKFHLCSEKNLGQLVCILLLCASAGVTCLAQKPTPPNGPANCAEPKIRYSQAVKAKNALVSQLGQELNKLGCNDNKPNPRFPRACFRPCLRFPRSITR